MYVYNFEVVFTLSETYVYAMFHVPDMDNFSS
jgi:hypothetical protein